MSGAVQNQTVKREMNVLITALQGHWSPCKMREESAPVAYETSRVSFNTLVFFFLWP